MNLKTIIKNSLVDFGNYFGYTIEIASKKNPSPITPWEGIEFTHIYEQVRSNTLLGKKRLYMLYNLACQANGSTIAEIGSYRGGSAYLIASAAPNSAVHVFDTFEGMPETDRQKDWHKKGDFPVNNGEILSFLSRKKNISVHKGFFPTTATPVQESTFSLVHIDVDIYRSVTDCLEFFYPRTRTGGVLISDDYGFTSCPGAKEAWDTFFADKPERSLYLPTGQCLVIKQ
jgi:O-methyltransferase